MSHVRADWKGDPVIVCRSGYTGERGYELLPRWDAAEGLWDALVAAGGVACGLGARDTLRLEAGNRLYGQDMDDDTNPFEAGLEWVVDFEKGDFVGRDALLPLRAGARERELSPSASKSEPPLPPPSSMISRTLISVV